MQAGCHEDDNGADGDDGDERSDGGGGDPAA